MKTGRCEVTDGGFRCVTIRHHPSPGLKSLLERAASRPIEAFVIWAALQKATTALTGGSPFFLSSRAAAILLGVTTASLEVAWKAEGATSFSVLEVAVRRAVSGCQEAPAPAQERGRLKHWLMLKPAGYDPDRFVDLLGRWLSGEERQEATPAPAPTLIPAPVPPLDAKGKPVKAPEAPPAKTTAPLYLVACVSQKQETPQPARELYTSPWFAKARSYVEAQDAPWCILSAKYGLTNPEKVLAPYERTLTKMKAQERREWASGVLEALAIKLAPGQAVVILAGQKYREHLVEPLRAKGHEVQIPMMGIGDQLRWLTQQGPEPVSEPPTAPKTSKGGRAATKRPEFPPGPFVAFDLESTGSKTHEDRLTEIGLVFFDERGEPVKMVGSLINPQRPIPSFIQRKIGITPAMVRDKPTFSEIAASVHRMMEGRWVVAHNLSFDKRMLQAAFERGGLGWPEVAGECCSQKLAKALGHKQIGLAAVCKHYGIEIGTHHRAGYDAQACGRVLVALRQEARGR